MPRHDDRSGPTRLYVGRLSTRTRTRDLEDLFSKYGRVRDVDMKHDFAFIEFYDPRDADDARYYLNGRDFEGNRIIVEFARRGPGGTGREYLGRGPAPGTGRCYNCGHDGHWARDCKAGDWKNKCYRCGERGHIERNCHASPRTTSRYDRSHRSRSRSYTPSHSRSRSPDRRRSPPRSVSRSRSYSRSPQRGNRSPAQDHLRSRSHSMSRSPPRQGSRSRSQSPLENARSPSRSPDGHASRSVSRSPVQNATNGAPGTRHGRSPTQSSD